MVTFRIVQGSSKKLGKFPSKYIVADFYEGLCRCRFSVSPVTGNAVSSMYASRESMVLSMVGHLFQNYDTRYVRFFPTYTCNHSCYTIYVRFFVTYTCVLSCFVGFLFPSIWPFSYKRAYICAQTKPIHMRYKQACVYGVTKSRRIRGTELYRQQETHSCTMELKSNFSLN